ncbi:MAG TPA: C4-dicarboxylate ABC transporter, partial [Pseudomonas sp.]|nr:C4-dicarboxylate ABC transporter [Pseudomonas sp.]
MADVRAALSGAGFGSSRSHEWVSWRPHRRRPEIARAPYEADEAEHKPRAIIEQIRSFTAPLGCDATGEVASIRRRSPSRRL